MRVAWRLDDWLTDRIHMANVRRVCGLISGKRNKEKKSCQERGVSSGVAGRLFAMMLLHLSSDCKQADAVTEQKPLPSGHGIVLIPIC